MKRIRLEYIVTSIEEYCFKEATFTVRRFYNMKKAKSVAKKLGIGFFVYVCSVRGHDSWNNIPRKTLVWTGKKFSITSFEQLRQIHKNQYPDFMSDNDTDIRVLRKKHNIPETLPFSWPPRK